MGIMSQLSNIDPAKLAALTQIRASGQAILLGQITRFSWPGDTRFYTCAPYDRMPEFAGAAQAFNPGGSSVSFEVRLTSSSNTA